VSITRGGPASYSTIVPYYVIVVELRFNGTLRTFSSSKDKPRRI
jgi:hypothetical protein